MSALTAFPRWAGPMLFSCLAVVSVSACSSSTDDSPGTAGSGNAAGRASGGSASGGAGGTATGGTASGGTASGGTAGGVAGSAGAGAPGAGSGGAATAGAAGAAGGAGGASGGAGGSSAGGSSAGAGSFTLSTPAWTSQADCAAATKTGCGIFPKENIGTNIGGTNKSPELNWSAGPSATQSYAIVLHDLTNLTAGKPFVHWVMWNIPGATRKLPAGLETTAMPSVPAGSSQRAYSGNGYQGSGKCGNVYEFVLYALPTATFTPTGTTQTSVADGLDATAAPTATLRARSGAPGCTE